jgi:hypothetical protein
MFHKSTVPALLLSSSSGCPILIPTSSWLPFLLPLLLPLYDCSLHSSPPIVLVVPVEGSMSSSLSRRLLVAIAQYWVHILLSLLSLLASVRAYWH